MTRILIAGFSTLACGAAVFALAMRQGMSIVSPHFSVRNIDETHYIYQVATGAFSFRGSPVLHAELPEKHVKLDAAEIQGQIDPQSRLLKTAKLSGGVKGSLDAPSADGTEHFTFSGTSANYTNLGTAAEQSADIDVTGSVVFGSANAAVPRSLRVTGSHGLFKVRSVAGTVGLSSADLAGPVTLTFSGTMVDQNKHKTKVSGKGTGSALTVTRPATGTNYEVRLSGGVDLLGLTGPFAGTEIKTSAVRLQFDERGNFLSFSGEDATTTTVPTGKRSP